MKKLLIILLFLSVAPAFSDNLMRCGFGFWGHGTGYLSPAAWSGQTPDGWTSTGDVNFMGVGPAPRTGSHYYSAFTGVVPSNPNIVKSISGHTAPIYTQNWAGFTGGNPVAKVNNIYLWDGGSNYISAALRTDGKIDFVVNGSVKGTTASAITYGNYYEVRLGSLELTVGNLNTMKINTEVFTDTTPMSAHFTNYYVSVDHAMGDNRGIFCDDVIINDGSGTYQTSWPDDSERVLTGLVVADSAIADWIGGGGGTTTIYEGANNVPPLGTNSTETDATNIKNVTSSATSDYLAYLQSAIEVGMPAGRKITVVQWEIRHGEHATANTKSGAIQFLNNPTEGSETTFDFGLDQGLHHLDEYDGTNPRWTSLKGTSHYWEEIKETFDPNVRPLILVGKRTASTDQVCVDQIGYTFGYTYQGSVRLETMDYPVSKYGNQRALP